MRYILRAREIWLKEMSRYGWHGMRGNCNKTGCLAYGMTLL